MPPLERRQRRAAWLFLTPALGLIGIFFFLPIVIGFVLSLTDFDIYAIGSLDTVRFVGPANYTNTLGSGEFWNALRNTAYFVFLGAPLSVLVSLAGAILVSGRLARFKEVFRTLYFAPVITTLVAVAVVWRSLYHPRYGVINFALEKFGVPAIDWLGDPVWAMPAIVLMAVWKTFGYNMLIFVAGLISIPEELYEAAEIDGASAWQRVLHVTLPSLAPTFLFVSLITMIGYFQVFAEPYIMTQGGPVRSTVTLMLLMYEEGFRWWRMGNAAAIAFLLFVITLIGTLIQLRLRKTEAA
ncbi:MAG: sugar ABC transporter permease [Gemmatimonadetes bacterium]|nr:sugar ABC transporter permease [Gemmatimonadota bacterium]